MAKPAYPHRRKWINMLIDPRLQVLMFLPYVVTMIAFVITNLTIVRYVIRSFSRIALDPGSIRVMTLDDVFRQMMLVSSVGLIAASVVGFLMVVIISHRVLGPLYNIHRHVRRLKAGEYHHRIQLRRGDRLTEFADDLNAVTEKLRALAGTPSPKP